MTDPGPEPPRALPPGQRLADGFPVRHYGPVPRFRPDTWKLTVTGATLRPATTTHFDVEAFAKLQRDRVVGDLHCVTKWTVLDNVWEGVLARTLMEAAPPADDVTHVHGVGRVRLLDEPADGGLRRRRGRSWRPTTTASR